MRRILCLLLIVSLLLPLFSCSPAPSGKGLSLPDYVERLNVLCDSLGYADYKTTEKAFYKKTHTFSASLLSGLFEVTGTLSGNEIQSLSVSFSASLVEFIENADDRDSVLLSTFYLSTLLLLPMTEEYETADKEDAMTFLSETVFPSFEGVRKVGEYKLNSYFANQEKTSAVLTLTVLS